MGKVLLAACLLALTNSICCLDPLYTVTAPKELRPNSPYHVVITVHHAPAPVEVEASLKSLDFNSSEHVSEKETINSGETKKIQLNIGRWSSGRYQFTVSGSGGISFNKSDHVSFNSKLLSVFIQTDKAIYQPGQIVHFRIIAINSTLHALNPDASVYINDANGNRIKQWNNVTFEKGIYSGDLQLSDQVVLGDWRIFADIKDNAQSKPFTVAEYVLPTFEADIQLPPFATYNDSDIVATVVGKYTYGKPVKGDVLLNVTDYYCQYPCVSSNIKPFSVKSSLDEKAEIKINLVRDLRLPDWYRYGMNRFKFFASVTEGLTGRQQNVTKDFNLYQHKYKMRFDLPPNFKPGLKYAGHLKILYQDETPVLDDLNNVTIKYSYSWNDEKQEVKFPVPKDGVIDIELVPPENAAMIRFEATYKGVHEYSSVNRAQSLSERYIQITLVSDKLKVGDEVELLLNSTKNLEDSLILQVVGRGKVLYVENIPGSKTNSQTIKFPTNFLMAPKVRVIVYYATVCGEVVADALDFGIEGMFRTPVSVGINPNETSPGSEVEVTVKTNPNAYVGLSAIDQSVLLLKSGNDITEKEILTDFQGYEIGDRGPYSHRSRRSRYIVPWRPSSSSTIELFTNVGLIFYTNGLLARQPHMGYGGYGGYGPLSASFDGEEIALAFNKGPQLAMASPGRPAAGPPRPLAESAHFGGGAELMEPTRVRQFFPETFLWTNTTAGSDGLVSIKVEAPDTITSYFINAFAMDENEGLGLNQSPAKMQIFRPFFVTLNLPYSVVRGETLALQALVFNYLPQDVDVEVTLKNEKGEFAFVDLENEIDQASTHDKMSQTIKVKSGDGTSVIFYITPKKLGHIDIEIVAKSTVSADALRRKLLVKAEGVPTYRNKAMVVHLKDKRSLEEKVNIDIPEVIVEESERVEVSAISDILGTTINNIDKLLRMPYGCGEQNMLNFVPNIVITDYLVSTKQLKDEIKETAIRYMESGYQRELTYKRYDASFSAFGNSDKSGSTWLTAFVVRSFIQAKKYITIDDDVIKDSLSWLSRQHANGSFTEVGKVFHQAMQGGSSKGLGLTAYVLSAFLEAKKNGYEAAENTIVSKTLETIERDLDQIESDYDLVFVTYVLHLANSPAKDQAFEKMNARAKTEGDLQYWSMPVPEVNASDPYAYYNRPRSVDIEMTAYGLLIYTLRNKISEGVPIMKWLVSKRNENGGFESTQDTVVGIQALAQYGAKLANTDDSSVTVKFSYEGGEKAMTLTKENALVLHREQLPRTTRAVDITAEGDGSCVVQVSYSYNLPTARSQATFEISNEVNSDRDMLEVKACTKYVYEEGGDSNMAVMELSLPSGYSADKENLPQLDDDKEIKRVETKDGDSVIVIYFDKIGNNVVCTSAKAQRNAKVADMKPALITVYDYYDPAKRAEQMYDAPKISLCDLCETNECKEKCK